MFAGSVAAADAAAVVGADRAGVIFDLAALAERSLLVADVGESATRYRMLATVRSVAGRWLEESSSAGDVRRRHAEHFTDATRLIDAQIRTADEARGRRRLDEIVAEVRAAHRWARRHHPSLASAMSGALHFAAYSTFWNEPTEWSRSLLAEHPVGGADALSGARILVAGADANSGQLADARSTATALSIAPDAHVRAAALEILSDVALYDGQLSEVARITDQLRRLGVELGDRHAVVIGGGLLGLEAANGLMLRTYVRQPGGRRPGSPRDGRRRRVVPIGPRVGHVRTGRGAQCCRRPGGNHCVRPRRGDGDGNRKSVRDVGGTRVVGNGAGACRRLSRSSPHVRRVPA